jgi:hypothetical protein
MNSLPDDLGPRLRDSLNHGPAPELPADLVTGAPHRAAPKLANPRRRIQLAGGAAALVAAVAVVALAIGPGLGRPPLFTVASSSASGGASSASVPANGLMRIWADYRYHPGAGLSTSGGNGDVYELVRTGSGSQHASALATVFGLSGPPTMADSSDPTLTVGSTDGATPSLQITWSGTGDWWFSDPAAYPTIACSSVGAATGSGGSSTGSSGDIPPTSPDPVGPPVCSGSPVAGPSLAPTGANARSKAQKLFAQTGLTVPATDIQLSSDASETTATAYLSVGGVQTALGWGMRWSSAGTIASAYGHTVKVVDRGSRGTISAVDAVARLADSRWYGSAGPKYQGGVRMYAADGGGQGATSSTGSGSAPGPVASPPTAEPNVQPTVAPTVAPTDTPTVVPTDAPTDQPTAVPTVTPTDAPTPEPAPTGPPIIDVTINKAEPTLLLMWDSHGGAWLVPGYAMQVENGWWTSVVSLVPGVIELPPIPTVKPDLVPPSVGTPGVSDGGVSTGP